MLLPLFTTMMMLVTMAGGRPSKLLFNKLTEDYFLEGDVDPEISPGLFEGDIAGISAELIRFGINWEISPEKKWKNKTIPYIISKNYLPDERLMIDTAIHTLNFFTCVNFVPWDGKQPDYLDIEPNQSPEGCWSFVGRNGGQQLISLQRPTDTAYKCFGGIGKPIHELLHALGIYHEQSRPDRDKYITFYPKRTFPEKLKNFRKLSGADQTTLNYPYDYNSVMHYGSFYFSRDRRLPTLVPKNSDARIGQRFMLSKLDCLKINSLYNCFDEGIFETNKYKAFCNDLAY